MAYPQLRSCNDCLKDGILDGGWKHYRPNTGGIVEDTTAQIRRDMSGVWHGFRESHIKILPDGRPYISKNFVDVTPQDVENV